MEKAEGTCLEELSERAELAPKPLQRQLSKGPHLVLTALKELPHYQQRWRKFQCRRSTGIPSFCKHDFDGNDGIGGCADPRIATGF